MTSALGLSCFYHDSAAALVIDSELIAAAQQERFSRIKHDSLFPIDAVRFCLDYAGLRLSELDAVVFYEEPDYKLFRILQTIGEPHPNRRSFLARVLPEWLQHPDLIRDRLLNGLLRIDPNFDGTKLRYTQHHRSHAASAFFPSPFDTAAVLTIDGVGEFATTSIHVGKRPQLKLLKQIEFPNSIGLLYAAFTAYLGFKVNDGEYKVMGLAPYGQPRFVDQIKHELITLHDDGSFVINQEYFDFFTSDRMYNDRLAILLGEPPRTGKDEPLTQFHMDVAASIQAVTTEVVLALARAAVRETGQRNLCLAGGVALNCVGNGHLLRSGILDRLWIQPAAGDAGGAIGAAFVGAVDLVKRPVSCTTLGAFPKKVERVKRQAPDADRMNGAYLGPGFSDEAIVAYLSSVGAAFNVIGDDESLVASTVRHLTAGHVVGWYQGRMEFGPRALGNRSILADPRSPSMQRTLNLKTKNRESFRPFAPAVVAEASRDWFSLDEPSPYMLLVGEVKHGHRLGVPNQAEGLAKLNQPRTTIPAVTHVDYSARVQTVEAAINPLFHRLLTAFGEATGVPVLVNTSFNVSDEPIVCTPEDAYRCFLAAKIDVLVIGHCILQRDQQRVTLPTFLDNIPSTGALEIANRWCVQWYVDGQMHALRNRLYQGVLSNPNYNQPVATTEYDTPEAWWTALRAACQTHFVVIACGGSTTAFNTNWPFFLEAELRKRGEWTRPIVVINLGQPMHSSFDLFFLLQQFLGEAERQQIKANLVVSLDGANDVAYRIQTFISTLRYGHSDAYCPNEVRLLDQLARQRTYPTVKAEPYRAILATKTNKFADATAVPLPPELEDGIIDCFATTLKAFRDLCRNHQLRCLNFLQPLLLDEWSSHRTRKLQERFRDEVEELQHISAAKGVPISSSSAFETVRRRHSVRLHIGEAFAIQDDPWSQGSFVFNWASIYGKCSELWSTLREREGVADFVDLSHLLAGETNEVFLLDGIHYTLAGSKIIATAIAEGLIDAAVNANHPGVKPSSATELGQATPAPRAGNQPNDILETLLAKCSEQSGHVGAAAPRPGWKVLNGQPPLNVEEVKRWTSLAAELREIAASMDEKPPSFQWETDPGALYPFY